MKYNHIGIPTTVRFDGEIDLPHLKITVSDHGNNPFGIQWQRYWEDAPYPDLVKTVPHVAFEVDDLAAAIDGQKIIIAPNCPSEGVTVAFIEVNGAPIELMQYDRLEKGLGQEDRNIERRRQLMEKINARVISQKAKKIDAAALIREDRDR